MFFPMNTQTRTVAFAKNACLLIATPYEHPNMHCCVCEKAHLLFANPSPEPIDEQSPRPPRAYPRHVRIFDHGSQGCWGAPPKHV
jgi:hypothetical protein